MAILHAWLGLSFTTTLLAANVTSALWLACYLGLLPAPTSGPDGGGYSRLAVQEGSVSYGGAGVSTGGAGNYLDPEGWYVCDLIGKGQLCG